jgi:hypothetical protein
MKWLEADMEKYAEQKQYIDTAVIPVYRLEIDQLSGRDVRQQNWLEAVCKYVEQQLAGRLVLLPTFYTFHEGMYIDLTRSTAFSHVVYVLTNPDDVSIFANVQETSYHLIDPIDVVPRVEDVVREGKNLTHAIKEQWKQS